MTSIPIDDFNSIMACLSPEMIDKLQYACQAFIKELLILKKDEEEKGNVETYSWLNIEEYHYSSNPIKELAQEMFCPREETEDIRLSVISDYSASEDVPLLRRFVDNYYICVYKFNQERCETFWKNRLIMDHMNNPLKYPNMMIEMAMYLYMDLNTNFVIDNLYYEPDTNNTQLK
jgi:hypothetical protein